ncbi:hypothetical protein [Chthoniobacter flavus]|uniref:hypothetical protein n=1 Tax=Chthoniobacter flavus TaxID=191863 RepID=UPI000A04C7BA|nr:hypothetical protein [Chthoniobacter flavus]
MREKLEIPIAYDPEGLEIGTLTIAECVCLRPRLYISDGSLAEVLALFAGYDMAGKTGVILRDQSPLRALRWLAEVCSHDECELPALQCERIIRHFGTETNALSAIAGFLKAQRTGMDRIHHTTTE